MKLFIAMLTLLGVLGSHPAQAQSVTSNKSAYLPGESIVVNFAGGPGNFKDWIGIYDSTISTPSRPPASPAWLYSNGTKSSGGNLPSGSVAFSNPSLPAGSYKAWFLANDGYSVIASSSIFTVNKTTSPQGPPVWAASSFRVRHGEAGSAFTAKISAYAVDAQDFALTYSKLSGPAWLNVAPDGALSGTPGKTDVGANSFTVRASNGSLTSDATLTIPVYAPGAESPKQLKVLSFNLWHGLSKINNGYRKGIEAIILSDADIIATQETVDNTSGLNTYQAKTIAEQLGWYYGPSESGDSGIVSRYPITRQFTAGIAKGIRVKITDTPLREVILYNCHLDYVNYGPYAARRQGATAASVLAEETKSQRDEQITTIMNGMAADLANADQVPVLLTGDFNAPSHLDWTPATAASHGGVGDVAWPSSVTVINAGMRDSFRTAHPNPATNPGNTWSPLYLGDAQDRIDFIYYKGRGLRPLKSEMFHTAIETTLGDWDDSSAPAKNNTWPSDHAAVLTEFALH